MNKKVTIITSTYNDARNLQRTIEQVKRQDYGNIEYIIVDGGSQDGTEQVIGAAREFFGERLIVIRERDSGIYDALNKGIRASTGDIIGCCFDAFTGTDVISKMVSIMEKEHTDGVHGDLNYMDGDRIVRKWRQGQGKMRFGWLPGHPTLYLKKEVYDAYGLYKEDYRVAGDYEFMVRVLWKGGIKLSYLPRVLIHMSCGGTSNSSPGAYLLSLKEGHRALRENGVILPVFTDICRIMRVLWQFR